VKLFLVSIGTWERSIEFAEVTGFPRDALLADPDSVTYEALGLVKGVRQTFFGSEVRAAQGVHCRALLQHGLQWTSIRMSTHEEGLPCLLHSRWQLNISYTERL